MAGKVNTDVTDLDTDFTDAASRSLGFRDKPAHPQDQKNPCNPCLNP